MAHYDFVQDDNPQTLHDKSGNGYDGTLGSTAEADTNDPQWSDSSLAFDGVDDYVESDTNPTLRERTLITVCTPRRTPSSVNPVIGLSGFGAYLSQNTSNRVHTFVSTSAENVSITNPSLFVVDETLFMAAVHGDNEISVWSGINKESEIPPGTIGERSTSPIILGAFAPGSLHCNTDIWYALVYDRPLSDGEIRQTYYALQQFLRGRGVSI